MLKLCAYQSQRMYDENRTACGLLERKTAPMEAKGSLRTRIQCMRTLHARMPYWSQLEAYVRGMLLTMQGLTCLNETSSIQEYYEFFIYLFTGLSCTSRDEHAAYIVISCKYVFYFLF